ncbi:helix-turn-helix domain-containing protein [Candidatus Odyssella acanthamoebae]|nr:helix-turn-helix domain-containing protein [Candidatus Paracaedibacter acanthamoebae]
MSIYMQEKFLNSKEASSYLGISTVTLAKWRANKQNGLPFIKIGRFIRYRVSDIEQFFKDNTIIRKPRITIN